MSSLVGGTRIIGQDMVCGFGNGKYKTFEGTEIVAENCVKAKVKDLRVEGKTYQNLFKAELSQGHVGNSSTTYDLRVNSEGFSLEEKTYTLYINTNYQLLLYYDYVNTGSSYVSWTDKIVWTNSTKTNNIRIMVKKTDNSEITVDEVIGKIVLLEGDYTTTELPEINGIESVSEKENNVLSVKINDNTTTLNLPIPLRSLPNNVCDTIEGNKLVQRVGKVVLENIKDYNIADQIKNNNRIGIMVGNVLGSSTRKPIISDHFFDLSNGGESVNGSFSYGGRIFLYLGLSTLEEYVEWFKGNPTTFYYSLSEPIIHDLKIPQLNTSRGTNVITTENNIKPKLKLKVKVKK